MGRQELFPSANTTIETFKTRHSRIQALAADTDLVCTDHSFRRTDDAFNSLPPGEHAGRRCGSSSLVVDLVSASYVEKVERPACRPGPFRANTSVEGDCCSGGRCGVIDLGTISRWSLSAGHRRIVHSSVPTLIYLRRARKATQVHRTKTQRRILGIRT